MQRLKSIQKQHKATRKKAKEIKAKISSNHSEINKIKNNIKLTKKK